MREDYDNWQLGKAEQAAKRSRDPSTKCGAVIIRPDKSICSDGYNGFPRGMEDRPEWYECRFEKYDRVIHAEMSALLATKESMVGYTMYITGPPCKDCAKHICAAGIVQVVWPRPSTSEQVSLQKRWKESLDRSLELFADCNVRVVIVD